MSNEPKPAVSAAATTPAASGPSTVPTSALAEQTQAPASAAAATSAPVAAAPPAPTAAAAPPRGPVPPHVRRRWLVLRGEPAWWEGLAFGALCIALVFGVWWFVTRGEAEQRIISPVMLPSPAETFEKFPSLWFDRALTRNLGASLRRVTFGFGLAVLVGVPLGVLCGCFAPVSAFLAPLSIFGRNIPVAALIPLTFSLFGVAELQKIMFIFIACVAFVLADTAGAIRDVEARYVDTAYTLGARRHQIILKVLFPLALPAIFNSARVLFGLAFGYIMLAEVIKLGGESGGLGDIIIMSQRRGPKEHILLILLIIPVVALAIDRVLFWIQRQLFPHQYGGAGLLNKALRGLAHVWEDLKRVFYHPEVKLPPLPGAAARKVAPATPTGPKP